MRSYEEALADAKEETPFSNHTMWEIWADRWCYECANDSPEMVDRGEGCPLIMVALMRRTPREWTAATERDRIFGDFTCSEFRRRPEPGEEDVPPPPPPVIDGQLDILGVFADQIIEKATDLELSTVGRGSDTSLSGGTDG